MRITTELRWQANFDVGKWFGGGHSQAETRPIIDKVVDALKAESVTAFAAVGYCFGGRYVFDLAFDNVISAAAVAHPSRLQIPADLEVRPSAHQRVRPC
jgi:dienelactone hydrolase